MYKVRFNLGSGRRYMTWKVTNTETNEVQYLEPNEVSLRLIGATLHNNKKTAKKINNGAHKRVCAWINCLELQILEPKDVVGDVISYNPRVLPYWIHNDENVDGKTYHTLMTSNKTVFLIK